MTKVILTLLTAACILLGGYIGSRSQEADDVTLVRLQDVALPYPCAVIRWYTARYTPAQLQQKGKEHGISLSAAQKAKIRKECFGK